MRLLLRVVGWIVGIALVLVLIGGGGGYLWLRRSLPQTSGELRAPGLAAPVQIVRDRDGVPHIRAQSEADALFALGYVHAQERLWQMEFQRRIGQARLSELFGPSTLETDRFLRTLGVYRAAQSAYQALAPEPRALLEAYAAGVNSFTSTHGGQLPIEFTILGVTPEPWRPEDSLVWAKMMAWDLGGNWSEELLRARLEAQVGAEAAAQLMPAAGRDDPLILPDGGDSVAATADDGRRTTASGHGQAGATPGSGQAGATPGSGQADAASSSGQAGTASGSGQADAASSSGQADAASSSGQASRAPGADEASSPHPSPLTPHPSPLTPHPSPLTPHAYEGLLAIGRDLEAMGLGGEHVGSNNWVVSGALTASGKPLLANDPHLGTRIPSIWYLAHITGGAIDAVGATLPGLPGVVIGHNARIAWGVTNTNPDVQDLFVEQVNARNEALYQGRWEPVTVISETIKVKGEEEVPLFVRVTRHGPLISDVTEGTGDPLAFRWTALDPEDHSLEAFLAVNRAQSWSEFSEGLRGYHAPMQNFVYADVEGNIGYYAPGALPIRGQGDGTRPAEGWSGLYDWQGYVPFEQLPHDLNPERGYIVTANNQAVPDSYPYLVSTVWAAPYRAQRIVELVEARSDHTVETMAALQADVVSLQALGLLPYLTAEALRASFANSPEGEQARAALELLRGWDGTMAGDSAAAAVYAAYYHALPEAVFGDELRESFSEDYTDSTGYHAMLLPEVLGGAAGAWCDNVNTPAPEGCEVALAEALAKGLETMAEAQGTPDVRAWRWDRAHVVIFPHNPFNEVEALRSSFSRSVPNGGDTFTVNVGPVRRSELYRQYHIPSYRHIVDMADLDGSRFMQSTGQSGNVLSDRYDNLVAPWQRVEYLPMRFSAGAVDEAASGTLTLAP